MKGGDANETSGTRHRVVPVRLRFIRHRATNCFSSGQAASLEGRSDLLFLLCFYDMTGKHDWVLGAFVQPSTLLSRIHVIRFYGLGLPSIREFLGDARWFCYRKRQTSRIRGEKRNGGHMIWLVPTRRVHVCLIMIHNAVSRERGRSAGFDMNSVERSRWR